MQDSIIDDTFPKVSEEQLTLEIGLLSSTNQSINKDQDTLAFHHKNKMDIKTTKRRKVCYPDICDLPDGTLLHMVSFLSKPSRALLALALTTDSKSYRKIDWLIGKNKISSSILAWAKVVKREPSPASKVILTYEKWDSLDFAEFTYGKENQLSDDDIAGVLTCINARGNLKSLKITGCTQITGQGLQPLFRSTILQQVNLTHKIRAPFEDVESCISELFVLPILDSIINTTGNKLMLIQFPELWRNRASPSFDSFLVDYERLLDSRGNVCSGCKSVTLSRESQSWEQSESEICWVTSYVQGIVYAEEMYGTQNYTCEECLKYVCYNDGCNERINKCKVCKEQYCIDCATMDECAEWACSDTLCKSCGKECPDCHSRACEDCDHILTCDDCGKTSCKVCTDFAECFGCEKVTCEAHLRAGNRTRVQRCDECEQDHCEECCYAKLENAWDNSCPGSCPGCIRIASPILGDKIHAQKQDARAKQAELEYQIETLQQRFAHLT